MLNVSETRNSLQPTKGGLRETLAIALPMMISYSCEIVMTFTDRIFLSRLSPEMMNAAMGGGLTFFMMMSFILGLTGYSTALVAQFLGAGRKDRCVVVLTQALMIAVAAYPLILIGRPFAYWLFQVVGVAPQQLVWQTVYFDTLIYAVIISLLRNCFSCFFSGIGKTRVVMLASLTAMAVNGVADYILIFGKLGAPALGIRGAAFATIIGNFCGLVVLVAAFYARANREEYGVIRPLSFHWGVMKPLLRFGYPSGLEMFLNMLAYDMMVLIFHAAGPISATASTIVFDWDMVSFVPLVGIEIGVTSLVGRYMGARQPDIAHRATMSGLKLGLIYSSMVLILFLGFPGYLVEIFRSDGTEAVFFQVKPMAVFMIQMASLYVLIEAMFVVFIGALRGAGDTFWTMCLSVGLHWVLVPILYTILHVFHMSPEAAWMALVLVFTGSSVLVYRRYYKGHWKQLKVIDQQV